METTDIVELLRKKFPAHKCCENGLLANDAADEIERLRRMIRLTKIVGLPLLYSIREELGLDDKTNISDLPVSVRELRMERDRLREINAELVGALETLYDEQNGPPLVRRSAEWDDAMNRARAIIARAKAKP